MAITAADLQVKLSTTGADGVKRDLQGLGTAVDDTGKKGRTFGETMRSALMFGAAGAVIGAGAGIVALGKQWVMGASNLAEAQTKVNTVYGQSSSVINKWAKTTAKAFGITETSALDTAGTMGNLFINMGFGTDTAADMSMGITELSADMASFNNVSQPQVIEALTSAFVGEYDSLQRLGVNISAAAVEQYALNNGIWDGVGAMTDAERATAVYGLTMEQTSTQQGDFARNADGTANQLRILGASFSELGARIGTVFLPAANAMVGWAIDAVDWMGRLADTFDAGGFGAALDSVIADLSSLGSQAIDVAITIGSFLWDTAVDIGADLIQWVKDNGLSVAQDLGSVAVSVGALVWNAAADIFSGFALWVQGMLAGAQDIGTVAVAVGAIAWSAANDIFGGFVTWVSQSIALEDFGIVGTTAAEKIRSALSLAFSGGRAVGGAGGAVLTGAASIAQWLADQINGMDFAAVGEAIGRKLAQATALVFAGGVGFETLKASFLAGISSAINDMDWDTIGTSFWNLFTSVMNAPQEFMQGVLTGVGGAVTDAIDQIDWDTVASSIGTELSGAIEGASDFAAGIGGKLNSELQQALNSVDFSGLAGLIGGKLSAAIEGVEGFATNIGGKLQNELIQAFNGIDWTGLGGTIATKLGDGIANTANFAASLGGKLLDEFTQAISGIDFSGIGSAIKDKLVDSVKGVGQAIWDAILSELTGASGGEDITPKVPPGGDIDPFFSNIVDGFGRVTDAANTARDAIGGVFGGGAGDGGRGAIGGGGGGAGALLGSITTAISSLTQLQSAAQVARAAMSAMSAAVSAGMAQIRAAFTAGMAAAVAAVTAGMASARAATAAGAASMAASMIAGMAAFRAAVTSGMAGAVAAVRSGIAAMVAAASAGRGQMMSAGLGIGAALGQGIAAGIRGQIGAVAAAAAALVSAAVGAARAAGAISSPSRVMQEQVGQMLGLGVAVGMEDMYPRVGLSAAGLVQVPTVPLVAGGGLNQGAGGPTVNVTVIVQGDLTAENNLTNRITEAVAIGLVNNQRRHVTAVLGGAP